MNRSSRAPIKPAAPLPRIEDDPTSRAFDNMKRTVDQLVERSRDGSSTGGTSFLGRQVLTSSGPYRPSTGTKVVRLRLIGGGGGGGSATSGASTFAAAGGGSSGVLLDVVVGRSDRTLKGGPFVAGAAGTGAAAGSPGSGGTGGQSSIVIDGTRYTANGGAGGMNVLNVSVDGLTNHVAPVSGDEVRTGTKTWGIGGMGIVIGASSWVSGDGGSTELGAGGLGMGGTIAGSPGNGFGSGGGGASSQNASRVGGRGAPGCAVIDEYG